MTQMSGLSRGATTIQTAAGHHRLAALMAATTPFLIVACLSHDEFGPHIDAPQFLDVHARTNPNNVLSTVVTFAGIGVDSARVEVFSGGEPWGVTPCYPILKADSSTITVLG